MTIRKGDKLICTEDVSNVFGWPLFEKGKEYEVLYVDNEKVKTFIVLNHVLYGNEYMEHELQWVLKRFRQLIK
jgi:hypothetical protein